MSKLSDEIREMTEPDSGAERVDYSVNLPDSELDVMLAMWNGEGAFTAARLMELVGDEKGWKTPTLISFLTRLEERGYVASYKNGKTRYYVPLADKGRYIDLKTRDFVEKFHGGSLVSLLSSMYSDRDFTDEEIDALIEWLRTR